MANLNDKLVDYKSLKENTKLTLGEALAYDKGLAGGYNGDFPLTVATKGNIYRVPATNKFYMCITDYNGSNLTAPNANFEELSVWANRDKLENLFDYLGIFYIKPEEKVGNKIQFHHNKNKQYKQVICSLAKTGIEIDLTSFDFIAYPLDNNTIELLILTTLHGNGRSIHILGII